MSDMQEKQAQNEKRQATVEQIRHQVNRDLTGEAEAFKQAFPGYRLVWNITVEAVQEEDGKREQDTLPART